MGAILNAIANYNPTGFAQENRQREAQTQEARSLDAMHQQQMQLAQVKAQQEQQDREREQRDTQIIQKSMIDAAGDPSKLLMGVIKRGGSPKAVIGLQDSLLKQRESLAKAKHEERLVMNEQNNRLAGIFEGIEASDDAVLPAAFQAGMQAAVKEGLMDPSEVPQAPDRQWLATHRNGLLLQGNLLGESIKKAEEQRKVAGEGRAVAVEGRAAALAPAQQAKAEADAIASQQKVEGTEPIQPADREKRMFEESKLERELLARASEAEKGRAVTMRGQDIGAATQRRGQDLTDARGKVEGGKPLPQPAIKTLETAKGQFDQLDRLSSTFKDDYAGNTITGGLENTVGRLVGDPFSEGQSQWWQDYQEYLNQVRHGLFGGALTPTERAEFDKQSITARMNPKQVRDNLGRQRGIVEKALKRTASVYEKGGYNKDQISEYATSAPKEAATGADPQVKAYADAYFGGDVKKAQAAIEEQRKK